MKKISVLTAALAAVLLAGCASDKNAAYLKDIDPDKYVTVGQYKGVTVDVAAPVVTDEELEDAINSELEYYGDFEEITDRDVAKEGDVANIDFVGKVDSKVFDGGSGEGYDLTLGSGQFIPGFEDQVIGMKVGETKDVNVTFPENYGNEELNGKDAVFTVTLNLLKDASKEVLPELTDEFVQGMGYDNVEAFNDSMREYLLSDKQNTYDNELYVKLQEKVEADCKFKKDAPDALVERLSDDMLKSITNMADAYGIDPGMIASYQYGFSTDNYEQDIKDYCRDTYAKQLLMMSAIAKKEGIEITDDDINSSIQEMLDGYGSEMTVDEYKEDMGEIENYREFLLIEKVMDLIVENAVINEN